jgi:hypothetical protein
MMPLKRILMVLLFFLILPVLSLADMCSWVDEDGVRHFSNTNDCPAANASISPEAEDSDDGGLLNVYFTHVAEKSLYGENRVQRSLHLYTFIPIDFPRENRY